MIDFHTHTFFSDGILLPSELIRRAQATGYRAIALTDHCDETNVGDLVRRAVAAAEAWQDQAEEGEPPILVIPGVEITHVPPGRIPALSRRAKELGARIVVVHGETPVEPVAPGTNASAVSCPHVDILAHPGLISEKDARTAARRGVYLEITTRKGHSLGNGHVAAIARRTGARLLVNTDAHEPGDLSDRGWARTVLAAAGCDRAECKRVRANAEELALSLAAPCRKRPRWLTRNSQR